MRKMLGGGEMSRCRRLFACAALALAFCGPVQAEEDQRDPYEGFNRSMFAINEVIDRFAAKPLAQGYDKVAPLPLKAATGNFFGNVGDLWIGSNNALQGKFGDAGVDIGRLLINSTIER